MKNTAYPRFNWYFQEKDNPLCVKTTSTKHEGLLFLSYDADII